MVQEFVQRVVLKVENLTKTIKKGVKRKFFVVNNVFDIIKKISVRCSNGWKL